MGTGSKDRDLQRSGTLGIHRLEGEKDFGFVVFDFEIYLGLPGRGTFSRKVDVKNCKYRFNTGFHVRPSVAVFLDMKEVCLPLED